MISEVITLMSVNTFFFSLNLSIDLNEARRLSDILFVLCCARYTISVIISTLYSVKYPTS